MSHHDHSHSVRWGTEGEAAIKARRLPALSKSKNCYTREALHRKRAALVRARRKEHGRVLLVPRWVLRVAQPHEDVELVARVSGAEDSL